MWGRLKTGLRLVLVLFGVPCFGWFFGTGFSVVTGGDIGRIGLLGQLCVGTAVATLVVLALVWLTALLARNNRALLAGIFGAEIRIVLALTCVLMPIHGAILLLSLSWGLPPMAQVYVLGPIAFGVVSGWIGMLLTTVRLLRLPPQAIAGLALSRAEQSRLWALVDQVGGAIDTGLPDRLILGLEPTFFATAGRIRLNGDRSIASGETLYLSAPLLRLLSPLELRAVIGHELGHFKGRDTAYSRRFVPIYRGLADSLHRLDATRGFSRIVTLPAVAVLEFCLHIFSRAERHISRAREIEADRLGALAASPRAIISTLVKLATFHRAWIEANQITLSFLGSGRAVANIAETFEEQTRQIRRAASATSLMSGIRDLRQPHPTDTHPTLEVRAAALGVDLADADGLLLADETRAIDLLDGAQALEAALTKNYQQWLIAKGYAQLP